MNLDALKWTMLGVMVVVTMIFGLVPIKLMSYLNNSQNAIHKKSSLILSLLSCFAGGVFLTVCFLDMLPDTLESWEDVKNDTGFDSDYPFVQLMALVGFFFVYILEELSNSLCSNGAHGHSHSDPIQSNVTFPRARLATVGTIFDADGKIIEPCKKSLQDFDVSGEAPLRSSLLFTCTFILHVFFECFAFGVQKDVLSVTSLFLGIVLHKAIVMFSLGMKLSRNHPNRPWLVVLLIFILALFNFLGGCIGIIIEDSAMNQTPKDITTTILMSFALGTFIYITFFEMLAPERANKHSSLLQWISSFLGFVVISIIMIWS
ncbi:unnamed protein product [Caenorhabditis angaria]|uniref:Uncharacterized protein n=1 Tax=Caenorhabditis angaria TaxID=860376 RepID=A0A9P1IAH9_9PELO|nr:unnamed protein product [Caenorhabditis angaria]